MQNRRDQLHAYRFQNRRALAALVTGEPNTVEAPMRRLTITTLSGVMIAVLVTAGFAVVGLIRPTAGDAWKEPGVVIIEADTGATFVRLDGVLHPTLNFASAVLAAGAGKAAKTVTVEAGDIASAKRGTAIGIPGLPSELPAADRLVSDPVTVCSRQSAGADDAISATVSVLLGDDAGATAIGSTQAITVSTGPGSAVYLLLDGRRHKITSDRVANALDVGSVPPLQVGTAFLQGVPFGPDLQAPSVPGAGDPTTLSDGTKARVGQLLSVSGTESYVVLRDGVAPVTRVQRALLQTLAIGTDGTLLAPLPTTASVALSRPSNSWNGIVSAQLAGLPADPPTVDRSAVTAGGVCAVLGRSARRPVFAVPPTQLTGFSDGAAVSQSATSRGGLADEVVVPPGRAAVAAPDNGSHTVFLIGGPGSARKFPATSRDVLGAFGYADSAPLSVPSEILNLIRTGDALDPSAARRPASGN